MGRAGRTPELPDDQPGQQHRREDDPRPRRDPEKRRRLPQRGLRPARRRHLDRHRHRPDGRPERPDLAHRLPRRMRPPRRKTSRRPGPGTIPALERQPRQPPRLGKATQEARLTPAPRKSPRRRPREPATPAIAMPAHRTSEYLRSVLISPATVAISRTGGSTQLALITVLRATSRSTITTIQRPALLHTTLTTRL